MISFELSPPNGKAATALQRKMAEHLITEDRFPPIKQIGGMDISNNYRDPKQLVYAAVVTLSYPDLSLTEEANHHEVQTFPYIPGLLGFREAPSLVHTFKMLKNKPDLILVDGHGISHPRGVGIASHIGIVLDIPTIGVAKSILVGKAAASLGEGPGSKTPLLWKDQVVGMLVRTRKRANPLIISSGHRISLNSAVEIVENCSRGYRLPEPTRHAHLCANRYRREKTSAV